MAIYVIGDVQGCFDELLMLIDKISFNKKKDRLWFVGDLVNRGPKSLETLRWIKSLGDKAVTVLGNHDLHLLATYTGVRELKETSNMYQILKAKDIDNLVNWLRKRPLMHYDPELNVAMVHAGLLPCWDIKEAQSCAREVETVLSSNKYKEFLKNMYGDEPKKWSSSLEGWDRLRLITNSFTRIRYCNNKGEMDFNEKGPLGTQHHGLKPWFEINSLNNKDTFIVFGHWSTLGGYKDNNVHAIDTGCVWGGCLTALKLGKNCNTQFQVKCEAKQPIL